MGMTGKRTDPMLPVCSKERASGQKIRGKKGPHLAKMRPHLVKKLKLTKTQRREGEKSQKK